MKGQASLESLVVLLVFITVLGVWLGEANQIMHSISHALAFQQARLAADKLTAGINTACAMGKGNTVSLTVYVPGSASFGDGVMRWENVSIETKTQCAFEAFTVSGKETLSITNNGVITVHRV